MSIPECHQELFDWYVLIVEAVLFFFHPRNLSETSSIKYVFHLIEWAFFF